MPAGRSTELALDLRWTASSFRFFCVTVCGLALWLPGARAQEKIPPLEFVPETLPPSLRADFSGQRKTLQQQLGVLQAAAAAFNAQKAEDQTDAEYDAVQGERARYIEAAKAFNRALRAEINRQATRAAMPAARVHGSGEFYFITGDGRKLSAAESETLPMDGGIHVVTGSNSLVQLLLPDETIFTLGPQSDMILDSFVYDPATSTTKSTARFTKGTLRWVTGKVAHRKDINVKIAVGDLGIRGTDFELHVEPDGAGYVKLFEGRIDIAVQTPPGSLPLAAGQAVSFTAAGAFSVPAPFAP